ncbi:hypothetical protein [Kaistia sp. UC242_56]|uniref:hypothetical protein n=1 Tax=Kaistia sp. UC242_56 TaxID=3374625 RepID=UPI00378FC7E0
MSALWAWFFGTRVGRYAAGVLAIAAIVAVALLKAFSAGRAQQKASQTADKLKAISNKRISDDEVDRMDAGARRDQLGQWMRDKR